MLETLQATTATLGRVTVDISPDAWQAIGVIVSAVSAAISAYLISKVNSTSRKLETTDRKIDDASALAEQARDYARPTGNGFAEEMRQGLARLETGQAVLVSDVATLKEKVSDQAVSHARLEGKLDGHLGAQAASGVPEQRQPVQRPAQPRGGLLGWLSGPPPERR